MIIGFLAAAVVFLLSLRSAYASYTYAVSLTRDGVAGQTSDVADEIRLRIETFFGERINDLRVLALQLGEREKGGRIGSFIKDAELIMRHESSYHLINFIDPETIIRASVPRNSGPELTGFDLKTLPGREVFHRRVRESGNPALSPLLTLTSGITGMVLWYPVFEAGPPGCVFAGTVAGTLSAEAVLNRCISENALRQFDIEIHSGGEQLYSSRVTSDGGNPEIRDFVLGTTARREFALLGQGWSLSVGLPESGNLALIFSANRVRFLQQVILFFLVTTFLCAAIWGLDRSINAGRRVAESEERLELALQGADLGLWDCDIPTGIVSFNERWAEMLGYRLEDLARSIDTWKNLIHPEDSEAVFDVLNRHYRGEIPRYETEHRLRSKNGDWIWVLDKGRVVERDAVGNPLRAAGTHLDITERKRMESDLLATLNEKEMLFKEVHHRVKNNLQIIISLLNLQGYGMKDETAAQAIRESRDRVLAMALIHEKLYRGGEADLIYAADYLRNLSERIFSTYNAADHVSIGIDVEEVRLSIDTAIPLGLILNELITNSLKYAFPNNRRGMIHVAFAADRDKRCRLDIRDDGVGLPPGLDIHKAESLGYRLVTSLTAQLKGTVETVSSVGEGLEVRVEFPLG